jgi:hypothetical protein
MNYHYTSGFIEARDSAFQGHLVLDSTTLSPIPGQSASVLSALGQYDVSFAIRWYQTSTHDTSWINPVPPGHFPATLYPRPPPHVEEYEATTKRQRVTPPVTKINTRVKDFINSVPLLETVQPLRQDIPVSTQLLERIPKGIPYPKFPDPSGTCQTTICFRSAFASPQNCCATRICKERRPPRQTRLHVDLGTSEWKSKPESYWAPLVSFLVDPQVSPILRPSAAFKRLTPSTNWT